MPTDSPSVQLDSFFKKYNTDVAVMARKAFAILRRLIPGANVLVYDNYNTLAIAFGPSEKASQAIVSLAVYPKRVSLYFLQGGGLADPLKLLKGSGKMARHIVIKDIEMLDDPAIIELINRSLKESMTPIDPRSKGSIVVKSSAVRQRPRRSTVSKPASKKSVRKRTSPRPHRQRE